ncbi:MBL fold metallo-hydrolase [Micromonospora sp. WMMD736]|uniref:MBL fold metallo-hydrolase n=1 Tax=Micromonospora sp. WMMD736 TaxID=3404112 RepID=UPI003B943CCF
MNAFPNWLDLLEFVREAGEINARNGTPLPSDDELWAAARRSQRVVLPEQVDNGLLPELRDAFNDGQQPTRFDMQAVVVEIARHGHHAHIDHSGGNTATIYAGSQHTDQNGDARWAVTAGPGWFAKPDHREPVADTSEFQIGPDDDAWTIAVPDHTSPTEVAALIVAVIEQVAEGRGHLHD